MAETIVKARRRVACVVREAPAGVEAARRRSDPGCRTLRGVRGREPWSPDLPLDVPGGRGSLYSASHLGKTTLASLAARLYDPSRGSVRIDGVDIRDMRLADLAAIVGVVSQEPTCCTPRCGRTCATPSPAPPTPRSRTLPGPRRSTTSSPGCPTVTTPWSARAGTVSPAARSSAWPSPGPCCATRVCSCWTRPPAHWTPRPSAPSSTPSTPWPGPNHHHH